MIGQPDVGPAFRCSGSVGQVPKVYGNNTVLDILVTDIGQQGRFLIDSILRVRGVRNIGGTDRF